MRIYIAGKLSSREDEARNPTQIVCEYIANLHRMLEIADTVKKRGHAPYIPGMDFLLGLLAGNWQEHDYRGLGMAFLEVCDAILVTSDSWGVQQEVQRAAQLNIPVYYDLCAIPDLINPIGQCYNKIP